MKTTLHSTLLWIQTAATNIWRFLLGILLILIAVFLIALVTIAAIGHYFWSLRSKKQTAGEILRGNGLFYKLIAIGIDILGNIIGGSFLNWLLLKQPSQFPFGVPGEKISSVIQWNSMINNLSEWGLNLKHDLDTIETDHCERSVLQDLFKARHTIDRYQEIHAKREQAQRTREFLAKYN